MLERGDAFGFVSHKGSPGMLSGEKSLHPPNADGEGMTDLRRERSSFSKATCMTPPNELGELKCGHAAVDVENPQP